MKTRKIQILGRTRLDLYRSLQAVRITNMTEQRANNRLFREFGLLEIEDHIHAASARDVEPNPVAAKIAEDALNQSLAKEFGDDEKEFEISEAAFGVFRGYMDKLAQIYPAGRTPQGIDVAAGLPMGMARALARLVDALDTAFETGDAQ